MVPGAPAMGCCCRLNAAPSPLHFLESTKSSRGYGCLTARRLPARYRPCHLTLLPPIVDALLNAPIRTSHSILVHRLITTTAPLTAPLCFCPQHTMLRPPPQPHPNPDPHPHFFPLHPLRDFYPDRGAPEGLQETSPAVDLAYSIYGILNSTAAEDLVSNTTHFRASWKAVSAPTFAKFLQWGGRMVQIGGFARQGLAGRPAC